MKTKLTWLVVVAVLLIAGGSYSIVNKNREAVKLGGLSVVQDKDDINYSMYPNPSGIVAPKVFIAPTAGAQSVDLNIQMTSSTTGSVLNWYNEFTNDSNCDVNADPSACNWYGEDGVTVGTLSVAHSSTTLAHTWTPNSTSVLKKNVLISTASWRYIRTTFSATVATSTIKVEIAPQLSL